MEALETAPITQKPVGFTQVFEANRNSTATCIVNVGGAGSGKSWAIAQLLISKMLNEDNKTFGICRHTFPALRMTAYDLFISLLKDYGVYREEKHNKTANVYSYKNNVVYFFSLDDAEKVKSTSFNYIWIEECSEISFNDFIILKTRLRGTVKPGELNHVYLSCNPTDIQGWVASKLCGVTKEKKKEQQPNYSAQLLSKEQGRDTICPK